MWYIAWTGLLNGTEGRGRPVFPTRADAQQWCDKLNTEWEGRYLHWPVLASAEPADLESTTTTTATDQH